MGLLLNIILFPAPQNSFKQQSLQRYVDFKTFSINKETSTLFIPSYCEDNKSLISNKALIYFHGNAEDLGLSMDWLIEMNKILNINIFANQYPGYGIHHKWSISPQEICRQAILLYNFVNRDLGFDHQNIVVVGRSIGSGPACHLAANTDCKRLVLISPFFSIKSMIAEKTFSWLGHLFSQRFPNNTNIQKTKAQILNIHGKRDDVIHFNNSQRLQQIYNINKRGGRFLYHPHMTHNEFNFKRDIVYPIKQFIQQIQYAPPRRADQIIENIQKHSLQSQQK